MQQEKAEQKVADIDSTAEHARRLESHRTERIVHMERGVVGMLAVIILFFIRQYVPTQSVMPVYIGAAILIGHAAIGLFLFTLGPFIKNISLPLLQYISSVIDVAAVSAVLWLFGAPDTFKSSLFLLYFLFIALASFRYSRQLTIFTAILSIVAYVVMFVLAVWQGDITLGTLSEEYRSSTISIASMINKVTFMVLVSAILGRTAKGYSRLLKNVMNFARTSQQKEQQTEEMRSVLKRYFTEDVADHIWQNRQQLFNERKEITVMFCDFRNFTALVDKLPTEHVVAILNSYLSEMVELVFKYHGTLDKYTGDGFMAIFGAPISREDDACNALCAAVEIERCARLLNTRYKSVIPDGLGVRLGISTGSAIVGNIGSEQRTEYTVIGEPVNLASRLESLNKTLHTTILISESTYQQAKERVQAEYKGRFAIRGIREPVRVFALQEVPHLNNVEIDTLEEA